MAIKGQWVFAATTGAFHRTTLLDDLREKILSYCNGELDSGSGATGDDNMEDGEYDPMSEVAMAEDPSCPGIALRGVKRTHYKTNAAFKKCVSFDMPLR